MAFQMFEQKKTSSKRNPTITILKSGNFNVNRIAYEMFFQGNKGVIFYYDDKAKKIGFKPSNEAAAYCYSVRSNKSGGAMISGLAFLGHHEISHDETRAFTCVKEEKEGLVVLNLGDKQAKMRKRRKTQATE